MTDERIEEMIRVLREDPPLIPRALRQGILDGLRELLERRRPQVPVPFMPPSGPTFSPPSSGSNPWNAH